MPIEHRFAYPHAAGMHARPASVLAEAVRSFAARATLVNEQSGATADMRSVLSVVALDIRHNDPLKLVVDGVDAEALLDSVIELMHGRLREIEGDGEAAAGAAVVAAEVEVWVPPMLEEACTGCVSGRAMVRGVGIGRAVIVGGLALSPEQAAVKAVSAPKERVTVERALAKVREDLTRRSVAARAGLEQDLVQAHASIAADPCLEDYLIELIGHGATAAQAVVGTYEHFRDLLEHASSAYIRDRVVDVEDVCGQLLAHVLGGPGVGAIGLREPSVVFADSLTPGQMMGMDRSLVKGLVLGRMGATSHTIILARSMQVPTVIGVKDPQRAVKAGAEVVVDASSGFVVLDARGGARRYYELEARAAERRAARLRPVALRPGATRDGRRLEVGVNATRAEDIRRAVEQGAEGVGLLRTEMFFLDRERAPTEEEQFDAYAAAVKAAAGRTVIFRTFDIGGDKPAPYMDLAREDNPFLGWRGIRLYERFDGLLAGQLRAILRAAVNGPVKIMAPMVATAAEAAWFKARVAKARAEVEHAGVRIAGPVPVGVMIEVPSMVFDIERAAPFADFFSIGTNDLWQYWLAADRGDPTLAQRFGAREPSFIGLLKEIADRCRRAGRWVGVCGEMAGERRNLALFSGLGVDEISVTQGRIAELKADLAGLDGAEAERAVAKAIACSDCAGVDEALRVAGATFGGAAQHPVDAEAIVLDSDAATKAEAIKEAVGALFATGRVEDVRGLERAVWAREKTYPTGMGFGFAIPHAKTGVVQGASIAVVRTREAVDWGAKDGQHVKMILLLAVPEAAGADVHLKMLAKLARRLMHEEFRERLFGAAERETVATVLKAELDAA